MTTKHAGVLFQGKTVELGERNLRVRWVDVEILIRERTR